MTHDYVFYVWSGKEKDPQSYVVRGQQPMLDEVVRLTKVGFKFAVYKVGDCIGDYS